MTAAVIVGAITVELFCITVIISVLLDTIYVRMFDKEMSLIGTIIMVLIVFAGVVKYVERTSEMLVTHLSMFITVMIMTTVLGYFIYLKYKQHSIYLYIVNPETSHIKVILACLDVTLICLFVFGVLLDSFFTVTVYVYYVIHGFILSSLLG